MGLIGSTYFGKGIDASKFVAGINLEMIGKTSSFGPNTAWLTGYERSDFGKIIEKNNSKDLFSYPKEEYTKKLIKSVPSPIPIEKKHGS